MTHALEEALSGGLPRFNPRPGFAAELLLALRRASRSQPRLVVVAAAPGVNRWMVAGTMASAVASAGVLVGLRRRHRRGRAA